MAIVLKEKEQGINWLALGIGAFFIVLTAILIYVLFLSESPFIEKISPTESFRSLDEIPSDYGDVLNKPSFLSRTILPSPETGLVGRVNPFTPY